MRKIVKSSLIIVGLLFVLSIPFACFGIYFWLTIPDSPPKEEAWPSWDPDSRHLTYECYLDGPISEGSRSIYDFDEGEGIRQSFYAKEAAEICISDVDGANQIRVTTTSGADLHPVWSPDGSYILYLRHQEGFYLITPDGHHQRLLIPLYGGDYSSPSEPDGTNPIWAPDGKHLLFSACLDNSDRDVYVVDVNTGIITNLTPDSRVQDIVPMWTLNGQKIVFLSTNSSFQSDTSGTSCTLGRDTPHQLKVINVDGSDESIIYSKEFYYDSLTVSNSGQIIFVADMVSKTNADYAYSPTRKSLYRISLEEREPVEIPTKEDHGAIGAPSWSPDGKYLAYISSSRLKVLDTEIQQVLEFPYIESFIEDYAWSPDSQYIAVHASIQEDMASDKEDHIYIFALQAGTVRPLLQE